MSTHFAHAYIKGVDSMPRKTSIVASLVRDRYVADAIVILENTPRRAARPVLKAIDSAKANLLNSGVSIDPKTIRIARISVVSFLHLVVALFHLRKSPATSLLK